MGYKPGFKTTEFWMALLTANVLVFKEHIFPGLPAEAILGIAGVVVAYVVSRVVVKVKG